MKVPNDPSEKDIVLEKLDRVPTELMRSVSDFLDNLLEEAREPLKTATDVKGDEMSREEWIASWDKWFKEVDELPPSDPSKVSLTKTERQENMAEDLVKKYKLRPSSQESA